MRTFFVALSLVLFHQPIHADALSAGNKALAKGDIEKAVAKWSKSPNPEAAYKLGNLAIDGKVPGCDLNCALRWHQKAVAGDYVPALTSIGALFFNDDQKEKGIAVFKYAAQWNDPDARRLLTEMGEEIPEPDLYNRAVEQRRQAILDAQIRQLEQQHAQAIYAPALGQMIGCLIAGSACGSIPSATGMPVDYLAGTRTGRFKSEYESSSNRICLYDTMQGDRTMTIKWTQRCPVTIRY